MRTVTKICGIFALISAPANAAPKSPDPMSVVAEQDRLVAGGRAVQIIIPQMEITTSYDAGRVARAPSGGILDTLIISSLDNKRQILEQSLHEKAEATVAPLRRALKGFDIEALALATTTAALAKPEWFQAKTITIAKENSAGNRSEFAKTSSAPQVAFINYSYRLSPDFSHIRVLAEISLIKKAGQKNNRTAAFGNAFYRQNISSIVQLRKPSYEHHENVESWSVNDGKLAKMSLMAAFSQLEELIPFSLALRQADLKLFASKDREKAFAADFYGPSVRRANDSSGDILIWSNGLIHVQSTPDIQ